MTKHSLTPKIAAGLAAAALVLSGCSSTKTEATSDNPYALKDKSVLTVCADIPYAPFEFQDDQKNIVGFDMDIADAIAKDLKVTKKVQVTPFEQIQSGSALLSNDCDVAVSSLSMTDARKSKMDFSQAYYADNLGLMVKDGSDVKTLEDAKKKKVGVAAGTTGAEYAKANGIDATIFKDTGLLIQGLKTGQVDAAIGNKSVLGYTVGKDTSLGFVQEYKTDENLGVAVKQGNAKLLEQVNSSLTKLKDSGELKKLESKWFGVAAK